MTYEKVKEIGKGSFGVVDLVVNEDGLMWARKTFAPPNLPGVTPEELRARFEREVRYQSQIDHPNVVKIHDCDLDANPPWFVMELAKCSLADELKADRTLGGDPREPLFDILAGLEAIHEKGYKHRDLSPGNVLKFVSDGGDSRYAISDFGLMSPETGQTSTLTASNMQGGTPLYRAPECVLNFKRATIQSDIYSVGAMGGRPGGDIASRLAISAIKDAIASESEIEIQKLFKVVQEKIRERAAINPDIEKMGTTLSLISIRNKRASVGHVGDSRVYHLRDDGIVDRTVDQTEVQQLLAQGILNKATARRYPRRNVLLSVLSANKDYDLHEEDFDVLPGDRILLLTDGVSAKVFRREIRDLSLKQPDSELFCRELSELIEQRSPLDDYSAVCLDVLPDN